MEFLLFLIFSHFVIINKLRITNRFADEKNRLRKIYDGNSSRNVHRVLKIKKNLQFTTYFQFITNI
jgi:hypothetical protein